jgi:hypothetical protein
MRASAVHDVARANVAFIAVVVFYLAVCHVVSVSFQIPIDLTLYGALTTVFVPAFTLAWLIAAIVTDIIRERPERPFLWIAAKMRGEWQIKKRVLYGLPVLLVWPVFVSTFTSMKSGIPVIVPFYADQWAMKADEFIHGGPAWEILQPFLGYPIITMAMNFFYHLWFLVFTFVLIFAAFMVGNDRMRGQFLVALVLTWAILGTGLAISLSSVGPCYYAVFYGSDPFGGLMKYLNEANQHYPIWALTAQSALLAAHTTAEPGLGRGISALPSLHVAVAVLLVMFSWSFSKIWRVLSIVFLATIMLGSVHLGWHYAIDGYISLALVPVIWWVSGRLVDFLGKAKSAAGRIPASDGLTFVRMRQGETLNG